MQNNSPEFIQASEIVKKLKTKPNDDELLQLYGLYKQAKFGNNNTEKPGFLDFKGSKKWNSWNENMNLSKYDSEVKYITIVNSLIKKYGIKKK